MGSLCPAGSMYTVARGPTVIVQKTRRGLNKTLDTLNPPKETAPHTLQEEREPPEIVFQPVKMRNNNRKALQAENVSPEHREIVTFVTTGWMLVKQEMEQGSGKVKYYQEPHNPQLSGFQPFDLDAWWGRKLYLSLTRDTV
eukprot:TRINITY_DN3536_c0_g1_i7.p1 TRINITY_DN3536_c0_g1~~TRINITY_DN3536_c0_g1_i7.p1  ORF type:complete len:153 (-),score=62.53 TRINITY_DN3536_c0_g1_i7:315-737(-)